MSALNLDIPKEYRACLRLGTCSWRYEGWKGLVYRPDVRYTGEDYLAEYARHFKQDPSRWFFLTGEMDKLNDLGVRGFKLNSVDGSLTHSTRFVLVDRKRRIRGFYTSGEDAFMPQLLHDVRQLEAEPRS